MKRFLTATALTLALCAPVAAHAGNQSRCVASFDAGTFGPLTASAHANNVAKCHAIWGSHADDQTNDATTQTDAADTLDDANVAALGIVAPPDMPNDVNCSYASAALATVWSRANQRLVGGNNVTDHAALLQELYERYEMADRQLERLGEHNYEMKQRGRTDNSPTCSEAFPQMVTKIVGDMSDTSMYTSQADAQARFDARIKARNDAEAPKLEADHKARAILAKHCETKKGANQFTIDYCKNWALNVNDPQKALAEGN